MLFPIMGLFLFFVPITGFLIGIILCCVRRLRIFAPFAFFIPLFASYGALAGFWFLEQALERLGIHSQIILNTSDAIGLLVGGALGVIVGFGCGIGLIRIVRRLKGEH